MKIGSVNLYTTTNTQRWLTWLLLVLQWLFTLMAVAAVLSMIICFIHQKEIGKEHFLSITLGEAVSFLISLYYKS